MKSSKPSGLLEKDRWFTVSQKGFPKTKEPSAKLTQKILSGIHLIGKELSEISLIHS